MAVVLNRAVFAKMVLEFLEDSRLTYREAARGLKISPSTFTRIMQYKSIQVDTFVNLLFLMEDMFPNALKQLYHIKSKVGGEWRGWEVVDEQRGGNYKI